MKKRMIQLLLLAGLVLPTASFAQNVFPANGNVGIGTTTPQAKLEIQGGANNDGTSDPRALAFGYWNGGGYRHWIRARHNAVLGAGNAIDFFVNNSSSPGGSTGPGAGNVHVMTLDSGRLGIGTAAPAGRLHLVDHQVDLRTSEGVSPDGWCRDGLTVNANPGVGFSTMRVISYHNPVADRYLLSVDRVNDWYFRVRTDGVTFARNVQVENTLSTTTLALTSDRHVKQDFQPVSPREIAAKVAALPITTWAYTNSPSIRHLGPMAQDFKPAFGLGEDDKHISAGDGIGVALAAIQGLHQLVTEKDSEIAALKRELASVKQELASVKDTVTDRLAALEQAVAKRNVQQASFRPEASR
jgi:hypothetical protein